MGRPTIERAAKRSAPSPVLVALLREPGDRRRLAGALQDVADLVLCDTLAELLARVALGDVAIVVAELRDANGSTTVPALAALRERWPDVRVLLYLGLSADDIHALADFVSAGTVIRGVDDIGGAALRAARGTVAQSAAAAIGAAIAPLVPPPLRTFFTVCAARCDTALSVASAARESRLPYRTLFTHLQVAGLPSPHLQVAGLPSPRVVVGWHRLLHAAWEADRSAPSRDRVAERLAFSSGSALSHLLAHRTGLTWRELRAHGGFPYLLERFRSVLRPGASGPRQAGARTGPRRRLARD